MDGRCLLDTNIIIGFLAADQAIVGRFHKARELFTSTITVGELHFGARKSRRVEENLAVIDAFIGGVTVLGCDIETAWRYGEIKDHLRLKGKPIPENDIWIAAICSRHRLTLITRDGHFDEVGGLQIENWS